jgi:hypothetical protein
MKQSDRSKGAGCSKGSRLVVVANLWTLAGHPSPRREWTLKRKVREVKAAGFDAVTAPGTPELGGLLRDHGLRFTGFFSSSDEREFGRLLERQLEAGAENVNVQLGDDDTPVDVATQWAISLMKQARSLGVYTALEVHRDTALETPEKTYAIAEGYRRATGELLPLTWDHSHLAVVKHLKPPLYAEVLLRERALIQAARLFHLRPFNGQHAQVPVIDRRGQLTPEFRVWLAFAEELIRVWFEGNATAELWVCPEIGPVGIHGYNLSIMEPSWTQACVCSQKLRTTVRKILQAI